MITHPAGVPALEPLPHDSHRTTAGVVAMGNLQAQIEGQAREMATGRATVRAQAGLVDLVVLRGEVLGCIADYERAAALADRLADEAPTSADAVLARARTRAVFHDFDAASTDLDESMRLGADARSIDRERASILLAGGRHDEALALCRDAVEHRADFHSLGALATVQAENGEATAAEQAFRKARSCYRGVSPIPLAQLDFRRAHMWMTQGELWRARVWLEDAVGRLPAYAPAQGHLAEVEARLGEPDAAITRLLALTSSSDDPDHAAQLARLLRETGRPGDAEEWRGRAAARYEELIALHLDAYADHAAEFWLEAGADPHRALWLANRNVEARPTRRAHALVARAAAALDGAAHSLSEA